MKREVALLVAVVVIASTVVAGCVSNPTSTAPNQSASQAASAGQGAASGTHDKVLQAAIDDDQQAFVNSTLIRVVNKTVNWVNETTAMVTFKLVFYSNATLQYTAKYLKFANDAQASDYVSSINHGYNSTTAMALLNDPALTTASSLNTHYNYEQVTNRLPTVNSYEKVTDQGRTYQGSYIIRFNEVVVTFNAVVDKSASPATK